MGLKILHSADWHLGCSFRQFSPEQQTFLKQEQRLLPQKIAELCLREDCDLMLLSGDIFDENPSRDILELVKSALQHCGVPVLIAPGNHDFCCPGSPWLENTWPENVFIFTGGLESVTIAGLNCRIYGAGYQSMDCPGLLEGFTAEGEERYHLAVLHADPVQTGSPYCPITASQVRNSGLQYLALGHIHKAGAFRAGATLCAWPGCPMGRGWDEAGSKGVCIVTIGDTAQVRTVTLDSVRFQTHQADISSDALQALESILPAGDSLDFIRVTLTGQGRISLPQLYSHFSRLPNLTLVDTTQPERDLWQTADEDSLEGVYFSMLRQSMEREPENAELFLLAAEISRSLLDGREVTV